MNASTSIANGFQFLKGGGELGELIRTANWSKTALGTPDFWPQSFRTTLSILLHSKFPMFLFWGPDLLFFYNDAYRPCLGNEGKHPTALGRPGMQAWPEAWSQIKPLIDRVLAGGEATWSEDQLMPIYRNGRLEDAYMTVSYSPVSDETGVVAGVFGTCIETTKTVSVVGQLKESEQRFQNLILEAPVGIVVLSGEEMRIRIVNNTYGRLIGRTHDELVGKRLIDFVPETEAFFRPLIGEVLTRGEPIYRYNTPYAVTGNQTLIEGYLNMACQPYKEQDGTITGVMVLCQDVTGQVEHREAVEESETRFRTMAEHTDILIAIGDETSNATYFNKAWVNLTGRPLEELLQFGWVDWVHPEDRDRYLALYLDAFAVRGPFTGEFRILNHAGQYRWLLAHGTARFHPDGSFAGYISSCVDITERKEYQQELERALEQIRLSKEAAQLGTFDLDLVTGKLVWDERCRTLFGISHLDAVSYEKDFVMGLHPEDRQRILAIIQNAFVKSISNGDYDVEYRTVGVEDQQVRWVRAKGKVYFDPQDKPLRFIGSVFEITEQVNALKRIEEMVAERTKELADANENLQRTNAELAQFAYIASHDLQEPLRKISSFSQLLENSLTNHDEAEARRFLGKISTSAERMTTLIRDVLLYSQLDKEREKFEAVSLTSVLQNAVSDYELLIEQKGAVVRAEELPVLEAIPLQMAQLFANLLGNALKFTRRDVKPVIRIYSEAVTGADRTSHGLATEWAYTKIRFSDNGIGIQPEYTEKIFNIFQRLHSKSAYEGTGIGLALCKKIVLNHHGAIYTESNPEGGATFTLILPLRQPAQSGD
ncbi:PAS domain-containing sensor histidine kinase [Larkinella sp. VNQ87]|uniref:PAS domain-containing sensor histidine kinase n=1 Tax=Larkinella sp. VNQ87 TaxID=3400921 RepID=UPI003C0C7A5D